MALANKVIYQNGAIREFEKPEVCEAIKVANANRWTVGLSPIEWDEREARLKKEHEKNTKAPCPGEEQQKEGNNALKEAASQFNDALLDEQAKKIEELTKDKELMKKASLSQLDDFIEIYNLLTKESQKTKRLGKEIAKLNSIIHDKNAVLSDVEEELRLSKIREKNLAELGLKYVGENEKLKKKLANMVVDKIDAQALKSAESALAYKEKVIAEKDEVIDKITKENNDYKKVVEEFRNKIADMTIGKIEIQNIRLKEKDDVIADLGKELAATKKELDEKTKLIETVRKGSKEYCEYGISAEKMIRKMANVIVYGKPVSSEDFKEYRRWANGYRYNPKLSDFIEEEEKKLTAKTLDFNAKCMKAARESINDVFESYAAKYAKSTLDELKDKAYESFNAKAHKLGLVGSEDGKGIPDQMVMVDIDVECGDLSGKIVLCGTDFVKMLKENEDFIHDLFEKKHKEIKEFMYAEAEQFFEGDGIPTKMEVIKPSRKFKKVK